MCHYKATIVVLLYIDLANVEIFSKTEYLEFYFFKALFLVRFYGLNDFSSYQFCVLSTNGMHSSHFKNRQSSILYLRDEIKTE